MHIRSNNTREATGRLTRTDGDKTYRVAPFAIPGILTLAKLSVSSMLVYGIAREASVITSYLSLSSTINLYNRVLCERKSSIFAGTGKELQTLIWRDLGGLH